MIQPADRADARPGTPDTFPFGQLGLSADLVRAVRQAGYERPTPIQEQAIPHVLAGKDVLGVAQTGTGKTAAFVLPILHGLTAERRRRPASEGPRVLVLSPTRELASQIARSFEGYGRHTDIRSTVVYGGVGQRPQVAAIRSGIDVLVATPGRLVDLLSQKLVRLGGVQVVVLDEADRMLDAGFLPDVNRILKQVPRPRQTLLFSATMPPEIEDVAARELRAPARVEVAPVASTPDAVAQSVYFVDQRDKRSLLQHLLADATIERALVFTRTKHGADRVAKQLAQADVQAAAIHGNKAQGARERALEGFRRGAVRVLVATDVAARGIDVQGISHVINYDIPNDAEAYVHRIGRTARAGAQGIALSFCSADERAKLLRVERLVRRRVPVVSDHPWASAASAPRSGGGDRDGGHRQSSSGPPRRNGSSSGPRRARGGRPRRRS